MQCKVNHTYTQRQAPGKVVSFVQGNMRVVSDSFSSQQEGWPVLPLDNGQGQITLQVLASALPRTDSFMKLGTGSSAGKPHPPKVGLFRLVI